MLRYINDLNDGIHRQWHSILRPDDINNGIRQYTIQWQSMLGFMANMACTLHIQ